MLGGVLTTGPAAVVPLIRETFSGCLQCVNAAKAGGKHLSTRHELSCLDAALSSVVDFLRFCSELLLSVPRALTQVTVLLCCKVLVSDKSMASLVEESARIFLRACLQLDRVTSKRREALAFALAKAKSWRSWTWVESADAGATTGTSFDVVDTSLRDLSLHQSHADSLVVIRGLWRTNRCRLGDLALAQQSTRSEPARSCRLGDLDLARQSTRSVRDGATINLIGDRDLATMRNNPSVRRARRCRKSQPVAVVSSTFRGENYTREENTGPTKIHGKQLATMVASVCLFVCF